MQSLKEVLFSMLIGLLAVMALRLWPAPSEVSKTEPAMINPPLQDAEIQLNWGLKVIHAPEAWANHSRGSREIKVAIIDTGCDINHPDLAANIWTNPGESGLDPDGQDKGSNQIDDDGNGFVDDVHGWNFASSSPVIRDEHGHGTHIAGIVGADHGVAPQVSLMILKYYDESNSGEDNLRHTIEAIRYAVKMGANIINYSGGGVLRSSQEEKALKFAADHQVLVVAAAGNEGLNSDFFHFYPADYDLPNILSVAAVDRKGQLLALSNYGRATVDIAAPGRNIYSTLPHGAHGFMSGTSQATAFVTGVAALMMADDPIYKDPQRLIRQLLGHGRQSAALAKIGRGQLLDAASALKPGELELTDVH
jgi:thermitase